MKQKLKIALLGYGKMGKLIEKIALDQGHQITLKVDSSKPNINLSTLMNADIAINFSVPSVAEYHIKSCVDAGVNIVSGTTGWLDKWDEITEYVNQGRIGFFYASNFSVGLHLFRKLNIYFAQLIQDHPGYQPFIKEIHHMDKLDQPSGTALTLAKDLKSNLDRIENFGLQNIKKNNYLPITAYRIGHVSGTHEIQYNSTEDKIILSHKAINRKGFALGALEAAKWMDQKKGLFGMVDMLG